MKILFILLCSFLLYFSAQAQIVNDSLEYRIRPDSIKFGDLRLSVQNFNFMRNYEYFNKFQDGYTLFGTQLETQLVYYLHPKLVVMAGINARKDFGNDGIYKTYPLLSIKYNQGEHVTFINGVLEGTVHHRYIEPIFDIERRITQPAEYGTQLIIDKSSYYLDAYISWMKMIYKPSPEQEQIIGGLSSDFKIFKKDRFTLSVPIQLTVFHQGGQIDTVSAPLQTLVNTAIGFKLNFITHGFIKNIRTENYYSTYKEFSPTKAQAFSVGNGMYLNGAVDFKYGSFSTSYWNASGFISPVGMPLYQSISQQIDNPGYSEKKRELIIVRYAYQKKLFSNLYLDFRLEPLMDLRRPGKRKIEFSNSMFLVYRQDFLLKKIK